MHPGSVWVFGSQSLLLKRRAKSFNRCHQPPNCKIHWFILMKVVWCCTECIFWHVHVLLLAQRRMSAEVNPSLVNWLTSMMSMRLHVILEHNPVTEDQIQHYVIYTQVFTLSSGFTPKLNHRIQKLICFYYVFYVQSESSQRTESDAHASQQSDNMSVEVRFNWTRLSLVYWCIEELLFLNELIKHILSLFTGHSKVLYW